jgi:nucleotide-binding universal stress UspA family protein
MNQILFPTAYTSHGKIAYRHAQKLAKYFNASITLVHIYETVTPIITGSAPLMNRMETQSLQSFEDRQWSDQMDKLKGFAEEMNTSEFGDIEQDFIVTDGDIVKELLEIVKQNNFDLVVMGMSRHHLVGRVFGNAAYSLIDKMTCPILLIPPDAHFMGLNRIIYGTAFEAGDIDAIDYLTDWCDAFDASLHVLHVVQNENRQKANKKMEELTAHYIEEQEAGVIDFKLAEGKIIDVMEHYVDFTSADILAVHRRKQDFWERIKEGSLTKHLAEEVKIPLLVLKS